MQNVKAIHVSESEIKECVCKENPWDIVKDAVGISKVHMLCCDDGSKVEMYKSDLDENMLGYVEYGLPEQVVKNTSLKVGD